MVEFAVLVSSISMLATSITNLQASIAEKLTLSDTAAVQQAVLGARRLGAPTGGARDAYQRAPYRQPPLRYVYATGWIAGTKRQSACAFASLDVDSTTGLAIKAIRSSASTLRQLRRLHLTAVQAGTAFAHGFVSACGGS